jgi:ABC-type transporter Mla MlaB component
VHLDLADVSYCDLAGLRAIVRLANPGGAGTGRPVVLHKVPEQLRAVLAIIGWDAISGLTVADPG